MLTIWTVLTALVVVLLGGPNGTNPSGHEEERAVALQSRIRVDPAQRLSRGPHVASFFSELSERSDCGILPLVDDAAGRLEGQIVHPVAILLDQHESALIGDRRDGDPVEEL